MINPYDLVDSFTLASRREYPHTAFHGSDCGGCFRKAILARSGAVAEPVSGQSRWTFHLGDRMEETICKAITHGAREGGYWPLFQPGMRTPDGFAVGHADVLLEHYGSAYTLLDIKSCQGKSFTYSKRDREKGIVGDSHEKNRMQVGCYGWWMSEGWWDEKTAEWFHGNKRVLPSRAGVWYAAKEVYLFEIDWFDLPEYVEKAIEWWAELEKHWRAFLEPTGDGKLPPEKALVNGKPYWMCNYCDFWKHCPNIAACRKESESE